MWDRLSKGTVVWALSPFVALWELVSGPFRSYKPEDSFQDMRRLATAIQPLLLIGFVLTGIVGGQFWTRAVLWGFACLAVGFAIGFLFGVPRVVQDEDKSKLSRYRQRVNANLEEISDWLTKIVVGLGLVELKQIPGWIDGLAIIFAASTGIQSEHHGISGAIIIFFTVSGFLVGYLTTRLFLQGALRRAEGDLPDDPLNLPKGSNTPEAAPDAAGVNPVDNNANGNQPQNPGTH